MLISKRDALGIIYHSLLIALCQPLSITPDTDQQKIFSPKNCLVHKQLLGLATCHNTGSRINTKLAIARSEQHSFFECILNDATKDVFYHIECVPQYSSYPFTAVLNKFSHIFFC
uniref:Uncharacterized protein n=1 Tax=Scleropages formosus TaxID=113540 RepID=A0A8C9SUH2_SCLFO